MFTVDNTDERELAFVFKMEMGQVRNTVPVKSLPVRVERIARKWMQPIESGAMGRGVDCT